MSLDIGKLYKYIPYALLLLAFAAIVFLICTGNTNVLIKSPILILGAFIIGSLFIIFTKKNQTTVNADSITILPFSQRTLRRCFIGAAALMLILVLLGLRTSWMYLVLLVILCVLILLQILSKNASPIFVILNILYVVASIILPFAFEHAYYFAGSDIIYHTYNAGQIVTSGFLELISASDSIYSVFPGLLIFTAVSSILTSYPVNVSLYIFMTLAFLGLSIFIYLLAKQFFPSEKIGLLALSIYVIASFATSALISFAPYAFVSSQFILLFYLLFRPIKKDKTAFLLLSIPVIVFAILSHHANQLPMLGFLMCIVVLDHFVLPLITRFKGDKERSINFEIILLYLFCGATYIYYLYFTSATHYFKLIFSGSDVSDFAIAMVNTWNETVLSISELFILWAELFDVVLCIAPAVIGMYFVLTKKTATRKQYLLGLFAMFFFVFFAKVTSCIPALNTLNTPRFHGILCALFAALIAYGLVIIVQKIHSSCKKRYVGSVFLILLCVLLLLPTCVDIEGDNDLLSPLEIVQNNARDRVNCHFTTSELFMFTSMKDNIPQNAVCCSDSDSNRYMEHYVIPNGTSSSIVPRFTEKMEDVSDMYADTHIFLRKSHIMTSGLFESYELIRGNINTLTKRDIKGDANMFAIFNSNARYHHHVYENGGNSVYAM